MRKFSLINAIGQKYNLATKAAMLTDPDGLGFETKNIYEKIGAQFLLIKEEFSQNVPRGKVYFKDYSEYAAFAKFVQYTPLTLEYTPTGCGTYKISVFVKKLGKTEIKSMFGLPCEIQFQAAGQWYQHVVMENSSNAKGKTYPYTYDYQYRDTQIGSVVCISDSTAKSPVRINIMGRVINPKWMHYVNNELVAEGRLYGEIPEGNRLVISSVVPFSIVETDKNGKIVKNRYQESDFSTKRFLFLEHGTNRIDFSHEGNEKIKVKVEGYKYYATI